MRVNVYSTCQPNRTRLQTEDWWHTLPTQNETGPNALGARNGFLLRGGFFAQAPHALLQLFA